MLPSTAPKYPEWANATSITDDRTLNPKGNVEFPSGGASSSIWSATGGASYDPYEEDDEPYDASLYPTAQSLGKPKALFWPWSHLYQVTDPAFWGQLLIACFDTYAHGAPEITTVDAMKQSVYQYLRMRASVQLKESLFGPQTDNIEVKVICIPVLRDGRVANSYLPEKPLVIRYVHPETGLALDTDTVHVRPFPPLADESPISSDVESDKGDRPLVELESESRQARVPPSSQSWRRSTRPTRHPTSAVRTAARLKCKNPATYVQQYLADLSTAPPPRPEDQEYLRRLQEQVEQMPLWIQQAMRQMEERMQQQIGAIAQRSTGPPLAEHYSEPLRPPATSTVAPQRAMARDDPSDTEGRADRWATTRSEDGDLGPSRLSRAKSLADLGSAANLGPGQFKPPKLTLDPFTGLDAEVTVDEWLRMYWSQMAANGYTNEYDLARFLILYLKGAAAEWYQSYIDSHTDLTALVWDRVVSDLRQQYHIIDSSAQYGIFKFLRPHRGESLMVYANKLEAALHRALPEATKAEKNRELVSVFMDSVPMALQDQLKSHFVFLGTGPPDFQQLRTFSSKWETDHRTRVSAPHRSAQDDTLRAAAAVFQSRPPVNIQPPAAQSQSQYSAPGSFSTFPNQGSAPLSFPPRPYGQYQSGDQRYGQYQSGDQGSQQQPRAQWQQQPQAQWQQWAPDPVTNFVYDAPQPPRERPEHASLMCTKCNQIGHFWRLCPTLEPCTIPRCGRRYGHYGRRCPALRDADYAQIQGTYPPQSTSQVSFQQQQGTGTPVYQYTPYSPPQQSAMPSPNSDAVPTVGAVPYQRANINRLSVYSPTTGGPTSAFEGIARTTAEGLGLFIPPMRGPSRVTPFRRPLDQTPSDSARLDWNSMDDETKQRMQANFPMTINRLPGAQPALQRQPLRRAESPEIIVGIDGRRIRAMIDSGAQVTTMSSCLYAQIHPEWDGRCLQDSTVSLYGFMAEQPAGTLGSQPVKLTFGNVTVEHQVSVADDPRGTFTILIGQDISRAYAHTLCEYKKTVRYNRGALKDVELPLITLEELPLWPLSPKKVHFQTTVQILGSEQFEDSFMDPTVPLMPDPWQGLSMSHIYQTPDSSPVMTESLPKRGILKHSLCTPSSSLTPTYSYPNLGADASFVQTPTPGHLSSEVVPDQQEASQVRRCRSQGAIKASTSPHEGPKSDVSAALPTMSAEQQSEESNTGTITPQEVGQVVSQETDSTIPQDGPFDIPVASKASAPARASRPVRKTRMKRYWAQLIRHLPPLADQELKGGRIPVVYYDHRRQCAYVSPKHVFDFNSHKDLLASQSAPIQAAITRANDELRMQRNAASADPNLQSSGPDTNTDEIMSRP